MNLQTKIRSIIKEELIKLLNEKTYNIDDDIDLLYNKYFKKDIEKIKQTGVVVLYDMFNSYDTDTSIFSSDDCQRAHAVNPCSITINQYNNTFAPSHNLINISINRGAVNFVLNDANGSVEDAVRLLNYNDKIRYEFSEQRIKGSISHELTHWLDETFNKKSISRAITRKVSVDTIKQKNKIKNINTHYMEINAQIGSIKQTKREFGDSWDELTFEDLIILNPSLNSIHKSLGYVERNAWLRALKSRMYREGLLGNKMYN